MTAQQSEFDQAFTDLSEGVNTLITDFRELNTQIQSLPPSGGTPAQLQAVKDLSAKVHAALPVEAPASPAPPASSPPPVSSVVDALPPASSPPLVVDAPPPTPPTASPVAAPVTPPADTPGTVTPQAL